MVVRFDGLSSPRPTLNVVPRINVTSCERGRTIRSAARPTTDVRYAPRPKVPAASTPSGCNRARSVIGLGGRPGLMSTHRGEFELASKFTKTPDPVPTYNVRAGSVN